MFLILIFDNNARCVFVITTIVNAGDEREEKRKKRRKFISFCCLITFHYKNYSPGAGDIQIEMKRKAFLKSFKG
jgi:hypothetical protein